MTDLIKRCPFCGSSAFPMRGLEGWAVHCNADGTLGDDETKCSAVGPVRIYEDYAVDAWNARVANMPAAFREQACTVSKTESTVTIDCDDPDLANELFEWLSEGIHTQPITETHSVGQEWEPPIVSR